VTPIDRPVEPPPSVWQLPDPAEAHAGEDLIVLGADLAPGTLLAAYRSGLFPMDVDVDDGTRVLGWWSPDPRGVLPLANLHISRSLRKAMRRYTITIDTCFTEVMRQCADVRRPRGWITEDFIGAYTALHELGWAHSVEVWNRTGELVGGLYGIQIGHFFAGESMFHTERDASKVALVAIVEYLNALSPDALLDVQWVTDHLRTLGAIEISRGAYLGRLKQALATS
jgi:leucyl/phenylalanyl-tRNA---protein transferase